MNDVRGNGIKLSQKNEYLNSRLNAKQQYFNLYFSILIHFLPFVIKVL